MTRSRPETITDDEVVFFILTKNPRLKTRLCAVLGESAEQDNTLSTCDFYSSHLLSSSKKWFFQVFSSSFAMYSRSDL